jgi:putative nucleotidyltransferase with HDIG domain
MSTSHPIAAYGGAMNPTDARALAEELLAADMPRRWSHVCAVARKADEVAARLGLPAELLVSAAWLHDVGYAPGVASTGFHPLDGARHLRALGTDETVVSLVAHHSCAAIEGEVRGLAQDLGAEFTIGPGDLVDALAYCDMTTGPDGESLDVDARLREIRNRYGGEDPVVRFIDTAENQIRSLVARTERRLRDGTR